MDERKHMSENNGERKQQNEKEITNETIKVETKIDERKQSSEKQKVDERKQISEKQKLTNENI